MVRRKRQNNLCGTRDEMATRFLDLHCTKESQKADQHNSMSKLGPIVQPVDLATVLGDRGEGDNIIKI